ncbi:CcdB family protein [Candidatus Pantoea formicae]|uniref:CcdB family protein n=1 Tax=Candidatus Pantoea formicae TaxID=2608355 RepID=UPI003ED88257
MNKGIFEGCSIQFTDQKVKKPNFPLIVYITSDIIGRINRRLVIPPMSLERLNGCPVPKCITPALSLDGADYVLITHEAATVPLSAIGEEVCDAAHYRRTIESAFDFLLDGID